MTPTTIAEVPTNPPAFPQHPSQMIGSERTWGDPGMTLRDWFAGQALANAAICTGEAPEWDLKRWFRDRVGIKRCEIAAKQAGDYADAMLTARLVQS